MSDLVDVTKPPLTTKTTMSGSTFSVTFSGSAESEAMSDLTPFLKALHSAAVAAKATDAVLDMRQLEFMSSSCLKSFVTWIGILRETPAASRYKVRFLADSTKHWQGRSLTALSQFAVDLIRVETT